MTLDPVHMRATGVTARPVTDPIARGLFAAILIPNLVRPRDTGT